jgi:glycosyltransferase 2 family protein
MAENPKDEMQSSRIFNPKIIKRGIVIFIAITILTFAGIFFYTDGSKNLEIWKNLDYLYILIGFLFIFNDLYIGGLRNHIFIKEFVPGISQMVSIKANLANIFMGAVTPSQSGGGPAQWYIFYRNGVTIADMVGASFYNWISTIVFFPVSGALAIYILKDSVPDGFVMHMTQFGFSVFTTLFVVTFLGLFAPKVFGVIITGVSGLIGIFKSSWGAKVNALGKNGMLKLAEYRDKYLGLVKRKPHLMLFSFLLTIVLYLNKYALAYIFVIAFGLESDFWPIVSVMAVSYLLLYFAPSPGGSGIAEISITALLVPFVGEEVAPSITLLHRSFLVFIPALLGAFVVLQQLGKDAKE